MSVIPAVAGETPIRRATAFALTDLHGQRRFRAVAFDQESNEWWVIPLRLECMYAVPESISLGTLRAAQAAKRVTLLSGEEDPRRRRDTTSLTEAERAEWQTNLEAIAPFIEDEWEYLRPESRSEFLTSTAKAAGISPQWLRVLLTRYMMWGMEPVAALPWTSQKGAPGCIRRPRSDAKHQLTDDDLAWINEEIDNYYSSKAGRHQSEEAAYLALMKRYSVVSAVNEHGIPTTVTLRSLPSRTQFKYRLKRAGRSAVVRGKRLSKRQLNAKHRPRAGKARIRAAAPGACYEFDAWEISEVIVVSALDNSLELETPRLWLMRDVSSGAITKVYLDVRYESNEDVLAALHHCLCGELERAPQVIPEQPDDLASAPAAIRADAILRRHKIDRFIVVTGIRVESAGSGRGDQKGLVEATFKVLLRKALLNVPSLLTADDRARGVKRGLKRVTLSTLRQCILLAVSWFNDVLVPRRDWPEGYVYPSDGMPSRRELFVGSPAQLGIMTRTLDRDVSRALLLVHEDAPVTDSGIMIDDVPCTCDTAEREGWFTRGLQGRPGTIAIIKDPADVTRSWWRPLKEGPLEATRPLDGHDDLIGIRRAEWNAVCERQSAAKAKAQPKADEAAVLLELQKDAVIRLGGTSTTAVAQMDVQNVAVSSPELERDPMGPSPLLERTRRRLKEEK